MKASFPIGILRKASPKESELFKREYKSGWEYARIMDGTKEYPETHRLSYELSKFTGDEIQTILEFAKAQKVTERTVKNIQQWIDAINNPKDATVPSVRAMKEMLISVMDEIPYKWIMNESEDGFLLPYLVTEISYTPTTKYTQEHVSLKLRAGLYYSNDEYSGEDTAKKEDLSFNFFLPDILENGEPDDDNTIKLIAGNILYDLSEVDESDDDDDDKKPAKKKTSEKPKTKRAFKKLLQILADESLFLPTEESLNTFFEHSRIGYDLSSKMGAQYICTGKGFVRERYSSRPLTMQQDGSYYRLVIDMKGIPDGAERQTKAYSGNGLVPYHPYIRCYNLTKYSFVDVHAALLQPYQYNDRIIDNMIVSGHLKDYLNMILGGKNIFIDIVEGKSGGMIVLASGIAGVGKTLTAEVYSEKMHLPLYQIQASQLGIEVSKIEANLVNALRRTERWGAVLLIDECDTYLRKRKEDLEQNAIVGIWLRLLEYFNGIMFLTTNMHDEIDDAILSRCSSHIKYKAPETHMLEQIIKVHCHIQEIDVTDDEAALIAKSYPMTGRDVRNMLKNIKKCYPAENGKLQLKRQMIDNLKDFIPFINK